MTKRSMCVLIKHKVKQKIKINELARSLSYWPGPFLSFFTSFAIRSEFQTEILGLKLVIGSSTFSESRYNNYMGVKEMKNKHTIFQQKEEEEERTNVNILCTYYKMGNTTAYNILLDTCYCECYLQMINKILTNIHLCYTIGIHNNMETFWRDV